MSYEESKFLPGSWDSLHGQPYPCPHARAHTFPGLAWIGFLPVFLIIHFFFLHFIQVKNIFNASYKLKFYLVLCQLDKLGDLSYVNALLGTRNIFWTFERGGSLSQQDDPVSEVPAAKPDALSLIIPSHLIREGN